MKPFADVLIAWAEENLRYEKSIGKLFWKKKVGRGIVGDEAGRVSIGYRRIKIMGKEVAAHRLIWIIEKGACPKNQIDHIDGNKLNNRIQNLRDVSHTENQHNQFAAHHENSSGFIGAHKCKRGCFQSKISVGNKTIFLGRFNTAAEASLAYLEAKKIYHPSAPTISGETGKVTAEVCE